MELETIVVVVIIMFETRFDVVAFDVVVITVLFVDFVDEVNWIFVVIDDAVNCI